jgi:hypothetical protein
VLAFLLLASDLLLFLLSLLIIDSLLLLLLTCWNFETWVIFGSTKFCQTYNLLLLIPDRQPNTPHRRWCCCSLNINYSVRYKAHMTLNTRPRKQFSNQNEWLHYTRPTSEPGCFWKQLLIILAAHPPRTYTKICLHSWSCKHPHQRTWFGSRWIFLRFTTSATSKWYFGMAFDASTTASSSHTLPSTARPSTIPEGR